MSSSSVASDNPPDASSSAAAAAAGSSEDAPAGVADDTELATLIGPEGRYQKLVEELFRTPYGDWTARHTKNYNLNDFVDELGSGFPGNIKGLIRCWAVYYRDDLGGVFLPDDPPGQGKQRAKQDQDDSSSSSSDSPEDSSARKASAQEEEEEEEEEVGEKEEDKASGGEETETEAEGELDILTFDLELLIKDEEDRLHLDSLIESEREAIIIERFEEYKKTRQQQKEAGNGTKRRASTNGSTEEAEISNKQPATNRQVEESSEKEENGATETAQPTKEGKEAATAKEIASSEEEGTETTQGKKTTSEDQGNGIVEKAARKKQRKGSLENQTNGASETARATMQGENAPSEEEENVWTDETAKPTKKAKKAPAEDQENVIMEKAAKKKARKASSDDQEKGGAKTAKKTKKRKKPSLEDDDHENGGNGNAKTAKAAAKKIKKALIQSGDHENGGAEARKPSKRKKESRKDDNPEMSIKAILVPLDRSQKVKKIRIRWTQEQAITVGELLQDVKEQLQFSGTLQELCPAKVNKTECHVETWYDNLEQLVEPDTMGPMTIFQIQAPNQDDDNNITECQMLQICCRYTSVSLNPFLDPIVLQLPRTASVANLRERLANTLFPLFNLGKVKQEGATALRIVRRIPLSIKKYAGMVSLEPEQLGAPLAPLAHDPKEAKPDDELERVLLWDILQGRDFDNDGATTNKLGIVYMEWPPQLVDTYFDQEHHQILQPGKKKKKVKKVASTAGGAGGSAAVGTSANASTTLKAAKPKKAKAKDKAKAVSPAKAKAASSFGDDAPKAIEVYTGPPDDKIEGGWPDGWIKKAFERQGGRFIGKKDYFWYSPQKQYKLRSLAGVKRFMACLQQFDNNEDLAWQVFKKRS